MYGKFFASAFNGSMVGAGTDVFATWGYIISHAVNGLVELNPTLVGAALGATREEIEAAVAWLCRPDEKSRNPAEAGCRLVQEGPFLYRVVSHHIYRNMRNEDERREYNRLAQQQSRARRAGVVNPDVNDSQHSSAQSEIRDQRSESDPDRIPSGSSLRRKRAPKASKAKGGIYSEPFEAFWAAWPQQSRVGKRSAA